MITLQIFLFCVAFAEYNETCNADHEAQKCGEICFGELKVCLNECAYSGDMDCQPDCIIVSNECDAKCPCNDNCPEGCPCDSWECACDSTPHNVEIFEKCAAKYLIDFTNCYYSCGNDLACQFNCKIDYSYDFSTCPCRNNCLNGCPCDEYECYDEDITTTDATQTTSEKTQPISTTDQISTSTAEKTTTIKDIETTSEGQTISATETSQPAERSTTIQVVTAILTTSAPNTCLQYSLNAESFQECSHDVLEEYHSCFDNCYSNIICETKCLQDYNFGGSTCPCQQNCLNGCPCEFYNCINDPTYSEDLSVLILNTWNTARPSSISNILRWGIDYFEDLAPLVNFTDVFDTDSSCSLVFRDQLLVFGRDGQIMVVECVGTNCKPRRLGNLQFNFHSGRCVVVSGTEIALGFAYPEISTSYGYSVSANDTSSLDPNCVIQRPKTTYDHSNGYLAYDFHNKRLMAISGGERTSRKVVEYFVTSQLATDWCSDEVINGTWETDTVEFPGSYKGTSLSFKGDIYIFGGYSSRDVYRYNGSDWLKLQDMQKIRYAHSSIVSGNTILHVGGIGHHFIEKWTFNEDAQSPTNLFDIKSSHTSLYNFVYYPLLYVFDN